MDNNQIYTQDATPTEAASVQTKKKGIKYIVLGIIAIALIIAVAIIVSNFMSKGAEEPNDLFYKNRIAYYDAEKDLWGYADKKGKKVIKAKYDEAYNFAECGLALVCDEEGMYGYIDTNGKTAIKFKYIAASSFNEHNLAIAVDDEGYYGVINKKGETVVKFNYAYIGEFNEYGTAPFKDEEGLWGFIDKKGKVIIKAKYDDVENFNEKGITVAAEYDESEGLQWGVIDSKGKWIKKPKFDSALGFDQFNRCVVEINGEYGIINQKGELVVKTKYEKIYGFSDDGLAVFVDDGEYGVFNTKGKEVIEADFEYITNFNDGIALAQSGNDIVIIGKNGKEIAEFDDCFPYGSYEFSENGLIAVEEDKENGKIGYMNKKGEIVIDFDFDDANEFAKNGLALVYDGKDYGYINKKGDFVIDAMYDDGTDFFDDGYAVVYGEDKNGEEYCIIINKSKEIAKFDDVKLGFSTKVHGDTISIPGGSSNGGSSSIGTGTAAG